ncbi:hypothetical protein [Salinigranum sp. GCM10025319]|uniref:hypothetical protein n=1 Tax=Salinigranum sp. GCM10025319 TaxID=3252687 RepID=UPI003613BAB5
MPQLATGASGDASTPAHGGPSDEPPGRLEASTVADGRFRAALADDWPPTALLLLPAGRNRRLLADVPDPETTVTDPETWAAVDEAVLIPGSAGTLRARLEHLLVRRPQKHQIPNYIDGFPRHYIKVLIVIVKRPNGTAAPDSGAVSRFVVRVSSGIRRPDARSSIRPFFDVFD